jgi:SepF-like predicted cell division protein (DUF552 family)
MSDDGSRSNADLDLDLQTAEGELDEPDTEDESRVVLGVLDGDTESEEWTAIIEAGNVLVLNVEGDLNELAAGFARDVRDMGGQLMHFRGFLVITPPDIEIDTDRL